MSVILTLKVVLIHTFTTKSNKNAVFSMVAENLALGCHGNVNLEPKISLFLALVDPIGIFLNLYEIFKMHFC